MITLTRIYTRPTTNTLWHWDVLDNTAINARIKSAYTDTQKLISNERHIDGLTATFTLVWTNQAALDEYDNDPTLQEYWTLKDAYNTAVGIITGPKQIT